MGSGIRRRTKQNKIAIINNNIRIKIIEHMAECAAVVAAWRFPVIVFFVGDTDECDTIRIFQVYFVRFRYESEERRVHVHNLQLYPMCIPESVNVVRYTYVLARRHTFWFQLVKLYTNASRFIEQRFRSVALITFFDCELSCTQKKLIVVPSAGCTSAYILRAQLFDIFLQISNKLKHTQ